MSVNIDESSPKGLDYDGADSSVHMRSAELRKDLGLADLTLTQVLFVVGLPWVGVAAKQGPAHVVLWLAAIILFYLPSAAVVIHLNRAMPLEGGLWDSWSRGTCGSSRFSIRRRSGSRSPNTFGTWSRRAANG